MDDTSNQSGSQGGQPPQAGGQQGAQAGGQPPAPVRTAGQKDLSGIMEENVDISSLVANAGNADEQKKFLAEVKLPAHPNTTFDEQKFLTLLASSISLTFSEKKKIVEAVEKLSQFQVDELMKIFEEEQQKFTELEKKHAEQLAELEKQHAGSPEDEKLKTEEAEKKAEEERQAEEIKKSLGL